MSSVVEKTKNGSGRPKRTYTTGPVTVGLRRLTLVATAAVTVWVLVRYPSMPDTVPVHFAAGGEADEWGSRATVLWLFLIMLVCIVPIHWASSRPDARWVNYPKTVTGDNAQAMYRVCEQLLVWTNVSVVVLYAGIAAAIIDGVSILLFVIPGLVLMVGGTVVGIVKMARA